MLWYWDLPQILINPVVVHLWSHIFQRQKIRNTYCDQKIVPNSFYILADGCTISPCGWFRGSDNSEAIKSINNISCKTTNAKIKYAKNSKYLYTLNRDPFNSDISAMTSRNNRSDNICFFFDQIIYINKIIAPSI